MKNKKLKTFLFALLVLLLIGGITAYSDKDEPGPIGDNDKVTYYI